ncbi:hypothetical protein EON81_14970 [bacterium]|nr:MAG: hypothetical protein EON81_14970 [bacterium]
MRAISFAWTTPAVLAGHFLPELPFKELTRRDWKPNYAASFKPGEVVSAWTKQARFGGEKFGVVRILSVTKEQSINVSSETDWHKEGFGLLTTLKSTFEKGYGACDVWRFWRFGVVDGEWNEGYTVRFELVDINEVGIRIWNELRGKHGELLLERPDAPVDGPALAEWRRGVLGGKYQAGSEEFERLFNDAHAEIYAQRGQELRA